MSTENAPAVAGISLVAPSARPEVSQAASAARTLAVTYPRRKRRASAKAAGHAPAHRFSDAEIVLQAVVAEAYRVEDCTGVRDAALDYDELKRRTRLKHDDLGLALNELISGKKLSTHSPGDRRIYYLPETTRLFIQKQKGERQVA